MKWKWTIPSRNSNIFHLHWTTTKEKLNSWNFWLRKLVFASMKPSQAKPSPRSFYTCKVSIGWRKVARQSNKNWDVLATVYFHEIYERGEKESVRNVIFCSSSLFCFFRSFIWRWFKRFIESQFIWIMPLYSIPLVYLNKIVIPLHATILFIIHSNE